MLTRGWRTARALPAMALAAVAALSWVRREPISISGRPAAAVTIREAAEAIARPPVETYAENAADETVESAPKAPTVTGRPLKLIRYYEDEPEVPAAPAAPRDPDSHVAAHTR